MCLASLSDLLALLNSYVKQTFNLTAESVKKNGRYVCWLCYWCQSACSDWRAAELTVMKCCIDFGLAVQCADTLLVSLRTQHTQYRTTTDTTDSIGRRTHTHTQYRTTTDTTDSIGRRTHTHTVSDNEGHNRQTVSDNDGHNRQYRTTDTTDSIGQRRTHTHTQYRTTTDTTDRQYRTTMDTQTHSIG